MRYIMHACDIAKNKVRVDCLSPCRMTSNANTEVAGHLSFELVRLIDKDFGINIEIFEWKGLPGQFLNIYGAKKKKTKKKTNKQENEEEEDQTADPALEGCLLSLVANHRSLFSSELTLSGIFRLVDPASQFKAQGLISQCIE